MEPFIIVAICVICATVITLVSIAIMKKDVSTLESNKTKEVLSEEKPGVINAERSGMTIQFEELAALTEEQESHLIEVSDKTLLAKIDGVIPGTIQAIVNAGAAYNYHKVIETAGQLYQAIIPKGAVLTGSRAVDGAFRGFYRGADNIKGHANFVPVNGNVGEGFAALGVANAAMSVGALIVGQYYMTQIHEQLDSITNELGKIAGFQENEFRSKVLALVVAIQRCSTFQTETMENENLRNRELHHLNDLEHECAQLLGQANLTLQGYSKRNGLDYEDYEKSVEEANGWFQYQKILLELLCRIEELTFVLNLGSVSKEKCYAIYTSYAKQANAAIEQLKAWHVVNGDRLKIDTDLIRRERQGVDRLIMTFPALFDDNLHYKSISASTAEMIKKQTGMFEKDRLRENADLFQEDVRLILKEGKLYYLPPA